MTVKQSSDYLEKLNRLEQFLLGEEVELTRQELKVLYAAIEGKTNGFFIDLYGMLRFGECK
jgi:hypothetical protein